MSQIFLKWFLMTSIKNEQKGLFGFLKNDTFLGSRKYERFTKYIRFWEILCNDRHWKRSKGGSFFILGKFCLWQKEPLFLMFWVEYWYFLYFFLHCFVLTISVLPISPYILLEPGSIIILYVLVDIIMIRDNAAISSLVLYDHFKGILN